MSESAGVEHHAVSGYEEWERGVHPRIVRESIWKFYGYRKALYAINSRGKTVAFCNRMSGAKQSLSN